MSEQAREDLMAAMDLARTKISQSSNQGQQLIRDKVLDLNLWLVDNPQAPRRACDTKRQELEKIMVSAEAEGQEGLKDQKGKNIQMPPTP